MNTLDELVHYCKEKVKATREAALSCCCGLFDLAAPRQVDCHILIDATKYIWY